MSGAVVWFRQDLRLTDNPAFVDACHQHEKIIPIYILDEAKLPVGGAQRWWLHHSLLALQEGLRELGLRLCLRRGNPQDILDPLVQEQDIQAIYWNRCYEPAAIKRDMAIKTHFQQRAIDVFSSNGSLLHEPWQIKNKAGDFFKVFTPYWRTCLQQMHIPEPRGVSGVPANLTVESESLESWQLLPHHPNWAQGFAEDWQPGEAGARIKLAEFIDTHLKGYDTLRDVPSKEATSKLSPHLHFGEISPWQVWRAVEAVKLDTRVDVKSIDRFLSEMGWREFSYYLLYHFPTLPVTNFKSAFNAFPWTNDAGALKRWQKGQTGYPIVDAGMRALWHTGYMHNRVRMIVASFLTKDLFIDWRLGASWFLDTLVDADLASNSASWQWVAGCGADAAPYFRIFNPVLQGEKFDPHGEYVKRWVPELKPVPVQWVHKPWSAPQGQLGICLGRDYPEPIVDHQVARDTALQLYKELSLSSGT